MELFPLESGYKNSNTQKPATKSYLNEFWVFLKNIVNRNKALIFGLFFGLCVCLIVLFYRPQKENNDVQTTEIINYYEKYKVVNVRTKLNVRRLPNTSSSIITQLEEGDIIYGEKSEINGWMVVYSDAGEVIGFAKSEYLEKMEP